MTVSERKVMKRKIFVMLLAALTMNISFCSCDENDKNSSSTSTKTTSTEDVTESAATKKSTDISANADESSSKSDYSSQKADESYYCMGKNDTCTNKTSDPYDFYCHSCDPDDNNIEGDQSKKSYGSGGAIIDNDYDNDIDEDDWEKAWDDYLNDKLNDYDYYDFDYDY